MKKIYFLIVYYDEKNKKRIYFSDDDYEACSEFRELVSHGYLPILTAHEAVSIPYFEDLK